MQKRVKHNMQFIFTGTTVADYKVTESKCIIFTSRDSCAE